MIEYQCNLYLIIFISHNGVKVQFTTENIIMLNFVEKD